MGQEAGTMKLKSKYYQKGYPVQLTYPTLKTKITWDGKGVADVPTNIAKRLLNKDEFGDGYEMYMEEKEPEKTEKEVRKLKMAKTEVKLEEKSKEEEFLDTVKD